MSRDHRHRVPVSQPNKPNNQVSRSESFDNKFKLSLVYVIPAGIIILFFLTPESQRGGVLETLIHQAHWTHLSALAVTLGIGVIIKLINVKKIRSKLRKCIESKRILEDELYNLNNKNKH